MSQRRASAGQGGSFTERVRDELAHAAVDRECCRRAELSAILRLGGALHLRGGAVPDHGRTTGLRPAWVVTVSANAIARRVHAGLADLAGVRPEIELHEASSLRPRRYVLTLTSDLATALPDLGVTDESLRAVERPPASLTSASHDADAYVRGALLAAGSVSDPTRGSHLELRVPSEPMAEGLRRLVTRCGAPSSIAARGEDWRVSSKSGAGIGALLTRTGAHRAFLEWDAARLRKELRGEANRAANADRANLGRTVAAAARQVAEIEAAVAASGWDAIPEDLRATALARLANPEASLSELADLHDPPVTKATVHRRMTRLSRLAEGPETGGEVEFNAAMEGRKRPDRAGRQRPDDDGPD